MAELVAIHPDPADVIGALDCVREFAEDVSAVAIAIVYRDGTTGKRNSPIPNAATMLGAVDRMRHKLNLELDEA